MITLGIDCGTQSTKVLALDSDTGKVLARAGQSYGLIPALPPGHMEQEPQLWTDAVDHTVREAVELLGERRNDVKGIGVSGQQHGFVALDSAGEVIRPAKLWCDTSTEEECGLLQGLLGGSEALVRALGVDMLPGFTAPKILWLKRHEPKNFARLATVLLPHDYVNFFLTGRLRMEFGDASGTALLDARSRTWNRSVVDAIDGDLAEKLPPLASSLEPVGFLKPELSKRWNLPADVVVSAGGGDNMMAAIGTGNTRPGRVTISLGTSGTIFAYSNHPVIDLAGEVAGFCDSTDAWLPLICTMNITVATEAVRALFGWSHQQMEHAIGEVPAGADGLLFLPYLQGERTPNLPKGSGVFHGLTTKTMAPAYLARATMEGVTMGLAYGLERLKKLGVVPTEIRVTGGGSKSAGWRQICADIFNCPMMNLAESEGAALGAAIQALASVEPAFTVDGWAERLVQLQDATEPQIDSGCDYQAVLRRHTELTQLLARNGYL